MASFLLYNKIIGWTNLFKQDYHIQFQYEKKGCDKSSYTFVFFSWSRLILAGSDHLKSIFLLILKKIVLKTENILNILTLV